jgi:hypothetical protein|tara:strand:+ start:5069 stop:5281 length:213 start_codon:yes stop_codon:yes gene_type:complete
MGGKAPMQAPPPIDNSVYEKTAAAEAKVAAEKGKMLSTKKKGQYGTILTSGQGVEEEATTSQTLLGGKKY